MADELETEDEILDKVHSLDEQIQTIRGQKRDLMAQLDQMRAQAKFDVMSDGERAALLQVVQTAGISTAETVQ